jgi:hypothetical protein
MTTYFKVSELDCAALALLPAVRAIAMVIGGSDNAIQLDLVQNEQDQTLYVSSMHITKCVANDHAFVINPILKYAKQQEK